MALGADTHTHTHTHTRIPTLQTKAIRRAPAKGRRTCTWFKNNSYVGLIWPPKNLVMPIKIYTAYKYIKLGKFATFQNIISKSHAICNEARGESNKTTVILYKLLVSLRGWF